MRKLGLKSKQLLFSVSHLEKKHKVITYASLLFLTISTYFLRSENQEIKINYATLQERNIHLKDNMIIFNKSYESLPLAAWQKVKRGNKFIIQYVNPKYVDFFGHSFNYNPYEIIGKNNFESFPEKIAQEYYENDIAVSITGVRLECREEYIDKSGKKLDLKIVKWREIKNNKDTLIYGMVKKITPNRVPTNKNAISLKTN